MNYKGVFFTSLFSLKTTGIRAISLGCHLVTVSGSVFRRFASVWCLYFRKVVDVREVPFPDGNSGHAPGREGRKVPIGVSLKSRRRLSSAWASRAATLLAVKFTRRRVRPSPVTFSDGAAFRWARLTFLSITLEFRALVLTVAYWVFRLWSVFSVCRFALSDFRTVCSLWWFYLTPGVVFLYWFESLFLQGSWWSYGNWLIAVRLLSLF